MPVMYAICLIFRIIFIHIPAFWQTGYPQSSLLIQHEILYFRIPYNNFAHRSSLMKSFLKKYRILLAATLLLAIFVCARNFQGLPHAGTSQTFDSFVDQLFEDEVTANTMNLHFTLKNPKSAGITSPEVRLGSFSWATQKDALSKIEDLQKQLDSYATRTLDAQGKLTHALLKDSLARQQAIAQYPLYEEVLTPSSGVTSQLPILLAEYPFYSKQDVEDYLTLLSQMDEYFSDILSFEQKKAESGLFMSDKSCMKVISGCEIFTEHPEDNFLFDTFVNRLNALDGLSASDKESYIAQNQEVIADHVIPAYTQMISGLTKLLGCGRNDWGLCQYKDGKAYYEALVSYNTGLDLTIEEIEQQIADAREEDTAFCSDLLAENPKLLAESSDPKWTMTDENKMIETLKTAMLTDFPAAPDTIYEVCHVDPALSEYLAPAFYITAPIDDYSYNRIYINDASKYNGVSYFTTLAHEGFPGHLYQTISSYAAGDPKVQALLNYPAYTEGWATYVEMQAYYYANLPEDVASLLQHNQAATLSLYASSDIGIHYYGWKKPEMLKFWSDYGISEEETIDAITNLVLEDPGNYLKYYVGYLQFRQLHDKYAEKYGDQFDTVAFHEAILRTGPSPFAILDEQIEKALQ